LGEVLLILPEVHEDVAVLAVESHEIAAGEFDAGDVVAFGRRASVGFRFCGWRGEPLPGEGKMEGGIAVVERVYLLDRLILKRDLEFEESCLDADEAGLAPTDGGELVDQGLLDVGRWG